MPIPPNALNNDGQFDVKKFEQNFTPEQQAEIFLKELDDAQRKLVQANFEKKNFHMESVKFHLENSTFHFHFQNRFGSEWAV